jgi:hypothetical protein
LLEVAEIGQRAAARVVDGFDDRGNPGAVAVEALTVVLDRDVEMERRARCDQPRHAIGQPEA